jgi:hypothetical protein
VNRNARKPKILKGLPADLGQQPRWLRGVDLNHRPLGYEPNELPDCSTPQFDHSNRAMCRQTKPASGGFRGFRLRRGFLFGRKCETAPHPIAIPSIEAGVCSDHAGVT